MKKTLSLFLIRKRILYLPRAFSTFTCIKPETVHTYLTLREFSITLRLVIVESVRQP